jgi:hypothetical protein
MLTKIIPELYIQSVSYGILKCCTVDLDLGGCASFHRGPALRQCKARPGNSGHAMDPVDRIKKIISCLTE